MFGTEEQQKEMLEAVETYNENIASFGKSLGEGMKKLDEHADDLLKKTVRINLAVKGSIKLIKLINLVIIIFVIIFIFLFLTS